VASDAQQDGPPVVAVDGRSLRRDLDRVASGFAFAVLDTPSRLGVEVRAAMLIADIVMLPIVPGAADVWALRETLAVVEEARELRPDLRVGIVLNRAARTTLTGVTRAALEEFKLPVFGALGDRVAYGEATARGLGVLRYQPSGRAAEEMQALLKAAFAAAKGQEKAWRRRRRPSRADSARSPNSGPSARR
jgi:chromosome partitioning protein